MVAEGADVNFLGERGGTALHVAALGGHVKVVKALVEQGVDVNLQAEDGCTALHLASSEGHMDAVIELLGAGADVHAETPDGELALDMAFQGGHAEVLEVLKESGGYESEEDSDIDPAEFARLESDLGKILNLNRNPKGSNPNGMTPEMKRRILVDMGLVAE